MIGKSIDFWSDWSASTAVLRANVMAATNNKYDTIWSRMRAIILVNKRPQSSGGPFIIPYLYLSCVDLLPGWVDDEEVSVNGYEDDGAGGEEDTGGLGGTNQLAQDLLPLQIWGK